ncbi:uncharacterized protein METZ01_LOCUS475604, partial [marine metagenome]
MGNGFFLLFNATAQADILYLRDGTA